MPIYDYKCEKCKTDFTAILKFSEMDIPQPCEKCSTPTNRDKTPKPTNFSLKGSGWAKDNYGLKGPRGK